MDLSTRGLNESVLAKEVPGFNPIQIFLILVFSIYVFGEQIDTSIQYVQGNPIRNG